MDRSFIVQLNNYRLTTAEILYWMPDHRHVLQQRFLNRRNSQTCFARTGHAQTHRVRGQITHREQIGLIQRFLCFDVDRAAQIQAVGKIVVRRLHAKMSIIGRLQFDA